MSKEKKFQVAYMAIAMIISQLSYCQKRKVGAVIVKDGNILGFGYNGAVKGMPNICEDDVNATQHTKDVHAEINAILKAGIETKGADMYTTCYPCLNCTILMAQAGIKRVFYQEEKNVDGRVEYYGMQSFKL